MGRYFTIGQNHFIVSGNAELDSADVKGAMRHVMEHGYGVSLGSQLLVLANPAEARADHIMAGGVESRAGGPKAKYDFIPGSRVPPYLTDQNVVGALPPAGVNGVPVLGSYGHSWVLESYLIPQGYFAVVASSGANAETNSHCVNTRTWHTRACGISPARGSNIL
jgi:hypothetical protein